VTPFVPRWAAPILFAVVVTCIMTCIVSGISTVSAVGLSDPRLGALWFQAWIPSWLVAAPIMTVVAPLVSGAIQRMTL
jgi:hypothetical protein